MTITSLFLTDLITNLEKDSNGIRVRTEMCQMDIEAGEKDKRHHSQID